MFMDFYFGFCVVVGGGEVLLVIKMVVYEQCGFIFVVIIVVLIWFVDEGFVIYVIYWSRIDGVFGWQELCGNLFIVGLIV